MATMSKKSSWDTNDTFQFRSTFSVLFASSVNSLIPPAPNSMLCYRCWGLRCIRNRKISIVLRERERVTVGGRGDVCKNLTHDLFLVFRGHRFDSCQELRFFFCSTPVSCWSIHLSQLWNWYKEHCEQDRPLTDYKNGCVECDS